MNARIQLKADRLDEEVRRFAPLFNDRPLFLNSVPKSGTHLLRNIVRMFTAPEHHYRPPSGRGVSPLMSAAAIQLAIVHLHTAAFDPQKKLISWGHLLFSDTSVVALTHVRHVLLIRDPYDWVLASARFFLSDQFQGPLNNIKGGAASTADVLNLMIFGAFGKQPSLGEVFGYNAVAWLGTKARVVKYEDLIRHVKALDAPETERFFTALLADCGIGPLPADWRERVRIGADRKHSGTSREKLTGADDLPDELPDEQKRLVDAHAPGLRAILGYA